MPRHQKGRAQRPEDLEALAQALRAVRKRAAVAKDKLAVGVTNAARVQARTEGYEDAAELTVKTAEDVFDSFEDPDRADFWEHRVWNGTDPDDLRRWFKKVRKAGRKEARREQPKKEPVPAEGNARGYAALPYLVLDRLLLVMPDAAFKVYCALLRFEGYKSGQMWPGQDRLAEITGLGEKTVWRSVKLLREVGLVTSRRRFGTSNVYERITVTPANVEAIASKLKSRPVRKKSPADMQRVRSSLPSRMMHQSRHACPDSSVTHDGLTTVENYRKNR